MSSRSSPSRAAATPDRIGGFGSLTAWKDLLAHGVVDELHVMVGPGVIGSGIPTLSRPVERRYCRDRASSLIMKAFEAITNLHTDDVERAREFFGFLGLTEDTMNQGWVARFTSADSGACVQVVTRDATAPEDSVMTIKVDDADVAYAAAQEQGYEIVHPITNEPWGIRRFFVRSPDGHVINVAQHNS